MRINYSASVDDFSWLWLIDKDSIYWVWVFVGVSWWVWRESNAELATGQTEFLLCILPSLKFPSWVSDKIVCIDSQYFQRCLHFILCPKFHWKSCPFPEVWWTISSYPGGGSGNTWNRVSQSLITWYRAVAERRGQNLMEILPQTADRVCSEKCLNPLITRLNRKEIANPIQSLHWSF